MGTGQGNAEHWHGAQWWLRSSDAALRKPGRFPVVMSTGTGKTLSLVGVLSWLAEDPTFKLTPLSDRQGRPLVPEGNHRVASGLAQLLDAARPGAQGVPGLRAEPFARPRMRARTNVRDVYRALCKRVERWESTGRTKDRRDLSGSARVRSRTARRAVLMRSSGMCENPDCPMPTLPDVSPTGEPLLEVDHIDDHAQGGRDHPKFMIALCPNCHTIKTRGRTGPELTERLRAAARRHHADGMKHGRRPTRSD